MINDGGFKGGGGYAYVRERLGIVSVKDFGAAGNGVTDDTAAIQAALDVGGVVEIPAGRYVVSSTLTISQEGTQLRGADDTVKWFAGSLVVFDVAESFTGSSVIDCTADYTVVKGVTISASSTTLTIPAVTASGTGNSLFRINVTNVGGISYTGSRFVIEDVTVAFTGTFGFYFDGAAIGFISRCNAAPNGNNTDPIAYSFSGAQSMELTECEANGANYNCLSVVNTTDSTFYDFEANGSTAQQILLSGCNDIWMYRTYVYAGSATPTVGIDIEDCSRVVLDDGWVSGCGAQGMYINGGSAVWDIMVTHYIIEQCSTVTTTAALVETDNNNYQISLQDNFFMGNANGGDSSPYAVVFNYGYSHMVTGNFIAGWSTSAVGVYDTSVVFNANVFIDTNATKSYIVNLGSGTWIAANNSGYNAVGSITPPASPLISGTVYQNTSGVAFTIYQPLYATTSGTAGSVAVALGASSTPNTLFTDYVPGDTSSTVPKVEQLRVPPGWYYSFTATGATLADAMIQGE